MLKIIYIASSTLAQSAEGYEFSHWEINGVELTEAEKSQRKLVVTPSKDLTVEARMIK